MRCYIYSQDLPTPQDFPICTYPVHPHGPTPYGRRCFSCMFLLRSSFLNSVVSLVCNYIIAPHLYNVNIFFTTFYIFIIHNLLTEMRLTFSIFREPYFLPKFLPIIMYFFRTKKEELLPSHVIILVFNFCFIFHSKILKTGAFLCHSCYNHVNFKSLFPQTRINTVFFAKRQIFRPQNQEFRQIGLLKFFFYI